MGHQLAQLCHASSTPTSTNQTQGAPDHVADVDISTAAGTRLDINNLDTQGRLTVPVPVSRPDRLQHLRPAAHRPLRLRAERRSSVGGGTVGLRQPVRRQRLLPRRRPDRLQPHARLERRARPARRLPALRGRRGPDAQLERLGPHHRPRRAARASAARPSSTRRPSSSRAPGAAPPSTPSTTRRASSSTTPSSGRTGPSTWACWPARTRCTARACGRTPATLSGFATAPGNKYKMYEIGFGKMIQPRLGATWSYNGKDTVYASYAKYNPAASSLPRAASWDRNLAATINAYFDQNGVLFATDPVASSSGKLFVEDLTPRTVDEFLVGTAQQFGPSWSAPRLRPLPPRQPLLGGHEQQRARRLQPAAGHSPRALHPRPARAPGPDRQRLDLRHRRAGRRLHAATTRPRWRPSGATPRRSCAARTPGATTTATSTRTTRRPTTTSTSSSAPRTSPTAPAGSSGTSRTATCAATGRHLLKLYGYRQLHWNALVRRCSPCSSRASRGRGGASSPTARSPPPPSRPTATRSRPARAAPHPLPAGPQLHAELQGRRAGQRSSSRPTSSTCSTSRPATASSRDALNSAFGTPRLVLRPPAPPAGGAVHVLAAAAVPIARALRVRREGRNSRSLAISSRVVAFAFLRAASIRAARSGSPSSTLTCARLNSAIAYSGMRRRHAVERVARLGKRRAAR